MPETLNRNERNMKTDTTTEPQGQPPALSCDALVRRSLSFQPYEIDLILKGLAALRDVEHRSCKWEKQEHSNQYYYTPNATVKRIAFIERSITRQLSAPNIRSQPDAPTQ